MEESREANSVANGDMTKGPNWKWSPNSTARPATVRSSAKQTRVSGSVASPASSTTTCENQPLWTPVARSEFAICAAQMHVLTTTLKRRNSCTGGIVKVTRPSSPEANVDKSLIISGTAAKLLPTAFNRSMWSLASPSFASLAQSTSAAVLEGAATSTCVSVGRCFSRCHTMKAARVLLPVPGGPHTTSGVSAPWASAATTARRCASFKAAGSSWIFASFFPSPSASPVTSAPCTTTSSSGEVA
mmetsp:Transcript_122947/g.244604  ORF Transcript_122947/g.244604 Transcript_122947/m.244604 type:complete len:244 (-) Transcript_122947:953-1684(-)